jgi:hypothetical protein
MDVYANCQAEVPGQGAQVRGRQRGGAKVISSGIKGEKKESNYSIYYKINY